MFFKKLNTKQVVMSALGALTIFSASVTNAQICGSDKYLSMAGNISKVAKTCAVTADMKTKVVNSQTGSLAALATGQTRSEGGLHPVQSSSNLVGQENGVKVQPVKKYSRRLQDYINKKFKASVGKSEPRAPNLLAQNNPLSPTIHSKVKEMHPENFQAAQAKRKNIVDVSRQQYNLPSASSEAANRKSALSYYDPSYVSAMFSVSGTDVYVGDSVHFYDESYAGGEDYYGFDNYIVDYYWEFGDGYSSYSANPSHYYNHAGSYQVTLTVTDSDGNEDWAYIWIDVSNPVIVYTNALYASFTASTNFASVDQSIHFTDTSYATGQYGYGSSNYITSESWNFGDNTGTYYGSSVYHSYSRPGSYTATLTVADAAGNRTYSTLYITVPDEAYPVADFIVSAATAQKNINFTFTSDSYETGPGNKANGNYIARLYWDFGDGSTYGNSTVATHAYSYAGTYKVTLYATDNKGNQSYAYRYVTVTEPQIVPVPFAIVDTLKTGSVNSFSIYSAIQVATEDVHSAGSVFVIAILPNGDWYFFGPNKKNNNALEWQAYSSPLVAPGAYFTGNLPDKVTLNNMANSYNVQQMGIIGTSIYAGYGKGGSNQAAWGEVISSARYGAVGFVGF